MKTRVLLCIGLAGVLLAGLLLYRARAHEAEAGVIVEGLDDDGNHVTLRVDWTLPDPRDAEGETHLYGLSMKMASGWVPYCLPDADGRRAAIPLSGSYDVSSRNILSNTGSDTMTFACTSGAIGKCVRFGYKPWKADSEGIPRSALHAACVRMVRADYCGNGQGHTVNGTRIDLYDRRGIQKPEPDPENREELEAGWSPAGATYLRVPRWSDDVAAIVRECPDHFAGRTSLDEQLTATQVAQRFPETLLFNNRMRDPGDRLAPQAAATSARR